MVLPALALAAAPGSAAPRAAEPPCCGAPAELLEAGAPLPATARAVAAGALRMCVGSASVLGPGTSGPAAAWPARLEALLSARYPGLKVETVVRGAPGLTAADSIAMVREELRRAPTHLVLWQTGAVETARNLDLDELAATLDVGLRRVNAAGADAVLIDPQFSRVLRANANVEPYREAMRLAAAAHNAPLVRRYDLMHAWAEADKVDLERAPRSASRRRRPPERLPRPSNRGGAGRRHRGSQAASTALSASEPAGRGARCSRSEQKSTRRCKVLRLCRRTVKLLEATRRELAPRPSGTDLTAALAATTTGKGRRIGHARALLRDLHARVLAHGGARARLCRLRLGARARPRDRRYDRSLACRACPRHGFCEGTPARGSLARILGGSWRPLPSSHCSGGRGVRAGP